MGAAYYILFFVKGKSTLSIHLKDFSVKGKAASGVLSIGIPAALGNLLMMCFQYSNEPCRWQSMVIWH